MKLGGLASSFSDDFLKIEFLKVVSDTIRPVIVAKEKIYLNKMTHATDYIMEYEAGKCSSVFSVGASSRTDYVNATSIQLIC